jgi:hypothetical protein
MTEEEAAPFGSELQPFPSDHKYHFEYVLRNTTDSTTLISLTVNVGRTCSITCTVLTPYA